MTPQEVAELMLARLEADDVLYQDEIVYVIERECGDEHVRINDNGNLAIQSNVLKAFRKLTEGCVVWEKGERCWRFRKDYDAQGRAQD